MRDKIVIFPAPEKTHTKGGIEIPEEYRRKEIHGLVLEVGPDVPDKDHGGCVPGDVVVFAQYAGTEIFLEDESGEDQRVLILSWEDIRGIIEEGSKP